MGELFTFFGVISENHTYLFMSHMLLTALIVIMLAKMATKSLKVVPGGTQNLMEAYLQGVVAMGSDVMGREKAMRYLPLVATLGLFIGIANLIGVIPGFEAPSAFLDFTLALALIVFIYYNFEGIRRNGVVEYFKHFMGPVWWLAWLMFPIEIVSHISRIVSLSFRLFGNVKGDDMFLMVMLMLAPWLLPMIPFALLSFMALLQAFIFMMLTYVYLGGAVTLHEESL
ncbi:F0F1 ATP synthase subunit A [Sulfurimonas sp. HSL-3221]|uniref:ATP synthase subunit a n=1 Tax=Sulfurimonas diazotrophicus TaxID=3131939 RepID=A0ABZ3HD96_9BACT|nr:F0F1 ATP synthase subunit A [Sulfurimonas sp. HSL-3221]UFS63772.1 F0F1 ATP synthase subunit A [Sulfurimonas sp. HSL-3221]